MTSDGFYQEARNSLNRCIRELERAAHDKDCAHWSAWRRATAALATQMLLLVNRQRQEKRYKKAKIADAKAKIADVFTWERWSRWRREER